MGVASSPTTTIADPSHLHRNHVSSGHSRPTRPSASGRGNPLQRSIVNTRLTFSVNMLLTVILMLTMAEDGVRGGSYQNRQAAISLLFLRESANGGGDTRFWTRRVHLR